MPPQRSNMRTLRMEESGLPRRPKPGDAESDARADEPGWERLRRRLPPSPLADEATAYGANTAGRPTPVLQTTWIDPEETPFVPVPRPGKVLSARLFSLAVMAAILVVLGWLIVPEVSWRLTNVNSVAIPNGVLTAQPVQLGPARAATVTRLFVDAGQPKQGMIKAGSPIAVMQEPTATGTAGRILLAPFDARLVSVDTLVGGVAQPGTPVITVFDPRKMYVIVTVRPATLDTLRRGMRAELKTSLLRKPIKGTVLSAVPLVGTDNDPARTQLVNVRIKLDSDETLRLVPGIRFDAKIDLTSAPRNAQPLVFTDIDPLQPASSSSKATAVATGNGS